MNDKIHQCAESVLYNFHIRGRHLERIITPRKAEYTQPICTVRFCPWCGLDFDKPEVKWVECSGPGFPSTANRPADAKCPNLTADPSGVCVTHRMLKQREEDNGKTIPEPS